MKWWFSSWNLFLLSLSKVCRISSADCFISEFTASQSTLFCEAKYSVLHLWNKWNTLYDKTGFPKKICVAKIFWEKEQPLKSPRRRKAVWIKGRVATQWATLCSTVYVLLRFFLKVSSRLWRVILIVICHCFTSWKTTKKPLIFLHHRLKTRVLSFSFRYIKHLRFCIYG